MLRDTYPGELRAADVGREVRLAGWVARRRDHGGLIFIDLRDRSGMVQLVFDPAHAPDAHALAEQVRPEFVLAVARQGRRALARDRQSQAADRRGRGARRRGWRSSTAPRRRRSRWSRRAGRRGRDAPPQVPLPRPAPRPHARATWSCATRPRRRRAPTSTATRFIEVETPILTKSYAGGRAGLPRPLAPAAGHRFYALPQSPQIFKQILMVAGLDRYYQFARCFRDEDLRADRQPEHTQIDIETSFLSVPEIREVLEGLMTAIFEGVGETPPATPLPRLSYDEAMLRYGSDKPGPEVRLRDRRAERHLRRERVQGVPRRRRRRRGRARHPGARCRFPLPGPDRQAHGARQGARRQGHGLRVRRGGPRAARPHRQVPRRGRAGRAGREGAAASPAT